jgi:transporter family protein
MFSGWPGWILASAVMLAFYDIAKKASVKGNAVLPTLLFSSFSGFLAYSAYIFATGKGGNVFDVNLQTVLLALSKSVIVGSSWIFTFRALKTLPVSIATPIRASSPALVFFAALFIYGEIPSIVQLVGMLIVFTGYWIFSWAGKHEGIDFFRDKAVWCAIAGACLSAVSSLWDKYVFQKALQPVEETQFYFQAGLVGVYGLLVLFDKSFSAEKRGRFEWRWTIPFVGILLAVADWLYFNGLSVPNAPVSLAALVRRFSVVITFILGVMIFREKNVFRKSLALAAVTVGVVLLCIAKSA